MVDVSEKVSSERSAVAECIVNLNKDTFESFEDAGWKSKGPIFDTAIIMELWLQKKLQNSSHSVIHSKLQSVQNRYNYDKQRTDKNCG